MRALCGNFPNMCSSLQFSSHGAGHDGLTWFTVHELQRVQGHSVAAPPQRGSVEQGHLEGLVHLANHALHNHPLSPVSANHREEYCKVFCREFTTSLVLKVNILDSKHIRRSGNVVYVTCYCCVHVVVGRQSPAVNNRANTVNSIR